MVLRHAYSNSHKGGRWPPLIILRRDLYQNSDVVLSNRVGLENHQPFLRILDIEIPKERCGMSTVAMLS